MHSALGFHTVRSEDLSKPSHALNTFNISSWEENLFYWRTRKELFLSNNCHPIGVGSYDACYFHPQRSIPASLVWKVFRSDVRRPYHDDRGYNPGDSHVKGQESSSSRLGVQFTDYGLTHSFQDETPLFSSQGIFQCYTRRNIKRWHVRFLKLFRDKKKGRATPRLVLLSASGSIYSFKQASPSDLFTCESCRGLQGIRLQWQMSQHRVPSNHI